MTADDVDGITQNLSIQGTPSETYGTFELDEFDDWTFTLDNSLPATQALHQDEEVIESFMVRATDEFGAFVDQEISIIIKGVEDVSVSSVIELSDIANGGDGTLNGNGGTDVQYGGVDNDRFNLNASGISALETDYGFGDNSDLLARIDGGGGLDTLAMDGTGLSLDLGSVANHAAGDPDGYSRLNSSVDIDDITNASSYRLDATEQRRQLLINGDSEDQPYLQETTRCGIVTRE